MKRAILILGCAVTLLSVGCGDSPERDGASRVAPSPTTSSPAPTIGQPVPSAATTAAPVAVVTTVGTPPSTTTTVVPQAEPGSDGSSESVSVTEKITIVILDADGNVVGGSDP